MSGATSVDQTTYEFRFMKFLENEREMNGREEGDLKEGLNVKNIRAYLDKNGSIEMPVVENTKGSER